MEKGNNYIWRHPFVTSDKGFENHFLNDVRLSKTKKQYENAGWQVSYYFKIDGAGCGRGATA